MPRYNNYVCGAWPAEDDIIPADLVAAAAAQPNSGRLFFMKVTVEFRNPRLSSDGPHPTRNVKELSFPADEANGLNREDWKSIRDELSQMGLPETALPEAIMQLCCCALLMVKSPENAGRSVLPMEALVIGTVEPEEQWPQEVEERNGAPAEETVVMVVETAEVCAVCLGETVVGSPASRLPCMHGLAFHENCIGEWFEYERSCPICRRYTLN